MELAVEQKSVSTVCFLQMLDFISSSSKAL